MPVSTVPQYRSCLLVNCHWNRHCTSQAQMEEGWSLVLPVQWCHYVRHVCWYSATLRYTCLNMETLSDIHAGFIYSYTRICKVLLYQVRHLVCFKPIRHATGRALLPRVCKTCWLQSWTPSWIYPILNDAWKASLGCYNDNVCNSRINKISILYAILRSLPVSGKIFSFFVINCHLGGHLVCILILFLIWLQAKCLQSDSNFIANNLRKKVSLRHFSISHNIYTYNWTPSWTPSWIYRNAQWCQSGITRIFQGQCMHYQNQQRKKFKIKFKVLLKFTQILPDYNVIKRYWC